MRSTCLKIFSRSLLYALFITALLFTACVTPPVTPSNVYSPEEWAKMFEEAGGWIPLPFPDSKYRPGAIIKVTDEGGIRWIDDLKSCRYPEDVLKPEKSYIPGITFTKGKNFGANAVINIKGIEAGPAFDSVSKVMLEVQDHGADAFKLLNLKVWWENPKNRKKVSAVCMDELKKLDRYLITEAFRVSKGTYTLYDKTGAQIKLTVPKLGDLLKFQPDVKYEVTADGKLIIDQPAYFAIRMAVKVGDGFEVLGEQTKEPQTADAMIKKIFIQSETK